jgi:hypothetical protein
MINIESLSSSQLRKVIAIKEKIEALESKLAAFGDGGAAAPAAGSPTKGKRGRRKMSAAGKAKIAAAQRARWAKVHAAAGKAAPASGKKGKRKVSPAVRAKLAAIARARWAKAKASGKSAL